MSRLTDSLLGRQIGSYLLEDLLGEGGMARVYLGRHHRHGTYSAVKVYEADRFSDAADAERFRREGRNMFRLRHPNIVKFIEFGVVEDLYYLVVEYVDGADLGWVLRQYRLRKMSVPLDDVIEIARQVGEALDYVHGEGIVHRDVKPSNILITRDGRALLTDFGLALSASESTQGTIFGSAFYVSPEQAVYSGNAVPESDIYSFGAVLYEVLVGSPPFEGETPIAIVLKHINEAPTPPSQRNPSLSPGLENVVLQALAKEPQDRYSTASDLVSALIEAVGEDRDLESEESGKRGPIRAEPQSSNSLASASEKLSVRDVVEGQPSLVTNGRAMASLAGKRQPRSLVSWRWGLIVAAVIMGALTAAVVVAAGRGDSITGLWRGGEVQLEPSQPSDDLAGDSEPGEIDRQRHLQSSKTAGSVPYLQQVSCSGYAIITRLQPGEYAYAVRPTPLYDAPRTEHNEAIGQFIRVLEQLEPGDRMLVLDHESYPNCYEEAYFLRVRTDDGREGWVHEWRWHYYLEP